MGKRLKVLRNILNYFSLRSSLKVGQQRKQ